MEIHKEEKEDYIIAVGASAGGLDALKSFLEGLPASFKVPIIIAQHLSPDHKSLMVDLLKSHTSLTVKKAEDKQAIKKGHLYILEPNKNISLNKNCIELKDQNRVKSSTPQYPIDILFKSLAQTKKSKAIGIILSGTGSDGSIGARELKELGGHIIVQDPHEAQFDGMPRSAIDLGLSDFKLKAKDMGELILDLIDNRHQIEKTWNANNDFEVIPIEKVIKEISERTNYNFINYKRSTLERRLQRRMSIHQMVEIDDYLNFLRSSPNEANELAQDFLINVTAFFRDYYVFETLKKNTIRDIVKKCSKNESIRVWVAACSSGEEAYSLAIIFHEVIEEFSEKNIELKVFATDIDELAIATAQAGRYPKTIVNEVPAALLMKYFKKLDDGGFEVTQKLRDSIIFSIHNVLSDPPFTRMDLISFRNCMIYLNSKAKNQVINLFCYALKQNSMLILGANETIQENRVFKNIDSSAKIYKKVGEKDILSLHTRFDPFKGRATDVPRETRNFNKVPQKDMAFFLCLKKFLHKQEAATIFLNENFSPVYSFGDLGRYAGVRAGEYSSDFSKMVDESLSSTVSILLRRLSNNTNADKQTSSVIRRDEGKSKVLLIEGHRLLDSTSGLILFALRFIEDSANNNLNDGDYTNLDANRIKNLEDELEVTKKDLKNTINELETANEELQTTNEELMSSNEELQSTNEELQSVNEELHTMNSEYQSKIGKLSELNLDMESLMSITGIGTLFLDRKLNIRKLSKITRDLLGLVKGDVGRNLNTFKNDFYASFSEDCLSVLETNQKLEKQIKSKYSGWLLVRILPQLGPNNTTEGLVVAFIDISELKSEKEARSWAMKFINRGSEAVYETSTQGKITSWSHKAEEFFGYKKSEVVGKDETILLPFNRLQEFQIMHNQLISGQPIYYPSVERTAKHNEVLKLSLMAFPQYSASGEIDRIQYILSEQADSHKESIDFNSELVLLKHIIETSPIGIVVNDQLGDFEFANNRALEILGLNFNELKAMSFDDKRFDISGDKEKAEIPSQELPIGKVLKEKVKVRNHILNIKDKNGKDKKLRINSSPLFSSDNKFSGVVTTFDEVL